MAFDKDAERRMSERRHMEDLCSKLTSLIPQEYRLDTSSQGSSDMPSQLMHATTYIKDLRERVETLKQRRDDCRSKIQQTASSSSTNTTATRSCAPHDVTVQFSGATQFDVTLTMSSEKRVELHKVISTIEQDQRIEVIEANSCFSDRGKIVYMLKCKVPTSANMLAFSSVDNPLPAYDIVFHLRVYNLQAIGSQATLDASMVKNRLRSLLTE